ncbi:hypothetical protein HPB49_005595 [Dermacentor silvarum]|uniref:Uncharacterized protein n=1 Tax=Dermacentor silvarum TaxID=543639 RepID=A0ACB8CPZ4_DERSI|nr:hypothetical protein HPB49_005595 [Dermacentor silvarum]
MGDKYRDERLQAHEAKILDLVEPSTHPRKLTTLHDKKSARPKQPGSKRPANTEEFPALDASTAPPQECGPTPTLSHYCPYVGATTTCLLVHKVYTAVQIDLDLNLPYDYYMVSVLPPRRGEPSIHILNVYCPSRLSRVFFTQLFNQALSTVAPQPLVIARDFNAPALTGATTTRRPRADSLKSSSPRSVSRCSLIGYIPHVPVIQSHMTLARTSPSLVTSVMLRERISMEHSVAIISYFALPSNHVRKCAITEATPVFTDRNKLRSQSFPPISDSGEYTAWASYALHTQRAHTQALATYNLTSDPHLLHLWDARRGLIRHWRRNKLNRKLRFRIEALTAEVAAYSVQLADSNWTDTCMKAAGQMSSKSTWRLFRSLLDSSTTRGKKHSGNSVAPCTPITARRINSHGMSATDTFVACSTPWARNIHILVLPTPTSTLLARCPTCELRWRNCYGAWPQAGIASLCHS